MKLPWSLRGLLATWFYSGLLSRPRWLGAGTWGSIASLPLCYLIFVAGLWWFIPAFVVIFGIGMLSIRRAEAWLGPRRDWRGKFKDHDQNQIVIDEVLGMLVTCLPLYIIRGNHPWWVVWVALTVALGLFRISDIKKFPPADRYDKRNTPYGVMMDDFWAGVWAAVGLALILTIFRIAGIR